MPNASAALTIPNLWPKQNRSSHAAKPLPFPFPCICVFPQRLAASIEHVPPHSGDRSGRGAEVLDVLADLHRDLHRGLSVVPAERPHERPPVVQGTGDRRDGVTGGVRGILEWGGLG